MHARVWLHLSMTAESSMTGTLVCESEWRLLKMSAGKSFPASLFKLHKYTVGLLNMNLVHEAFCGMWLQ